MLLVALCYRIRDRTRLDGPLGNDDSDQNDVTGHQFYSGTSRNTQDKTMNLQGQEYNIFKSFCGWS